MVSAKHPSLDLFNEYNLAALSINEERLGEGVTMLSEDKSEWEDPNTDDGKVSDSYDNENIDDE